MSQFYDPYASAFRDLNLRLQYMEAALNKARRESKSGVAERAVARAGRVPQLEIDFRSQYSEDVMLWELLGGQLDGFFIEVGAHDGLLFSVSYAFEAVGWKGLLIEAIPEQAEACRKNRPHSRVVHAVCTAPGGPSEAEFTIATSNQVLSFHATVPEHMPLVRETGGELRKARVPTTTMNELLKDNQGEIDFAVIDVEGGEANLLRGFDLDRHRPRILLIEDMDPVAKSPVMAHMKQFAHYEFVGPWNINRVWVRKDDAEVLKRVAQSKASVLA